MPNRKAAPRDEDVFRALPGNVALLDEEGQIVKTNQSWDNFGVEEGQVSTSWSGQNYLSVCGEGSEQSEEEDEFARRARGGIRALVEGKRERFTMEYPCHSPDEKRWFQLRAQGFESEGQRWVIVSHINITERRKKEEKLFYQATHDLLTGLWKKEAFLQRMEIEWSRSERYDIPLAFILLDLDHFKQVNDQHGHLVGDEVLEKVGSLLSESTRTSDEAARYGGEEFAVLLPETDSAAAATMAERIRSSIEEHRFLVDDVEIDVTASLGVATRTDQDSDPEDTVERADAAVYEAKEAGRNCIRVG